MSTTISVRAGDTEPVDVTISASGLSDLSDLDSAVLYARKAGSPTNHVAAGALTVADSSARKLTFDPAGKKVGGGDAFDEVGIYRVYVLATWTDGDQSRHPADSEITVDVRENYEA